MKYATHVAMLVAGLILGGFAGHYIASSHLWAINLAAQRAISGWQNAEAAAVDRADAAEAQFNKCNADVTAMYEEETVLYEFDPAQLSVLGGLGHVSIDPRVGVGQMRPRWILPVKITPTEVPAGGHIAAFGYYNPRTGEREGPFPVQQ